MLSDQAELPVRNEILNLPVHKHFTTRQNLEIWFVLQTIKIIFFFSINARGRFQGFRRGWNFFYMEEIFVHIYTHIYIRACGHVLIYICMYMNFCIPKVVFAPFA